MNDQGISNHHQTGTARLAPERLRESGPGRDATPGDSSRVTPKRLAAGICAAIADGRLSPLDAANGLNELPEAARAATLAQLLGGIKDAQRTPQDIPVSIARNPDRLIDAAEARAILGVGRTTFDAWVRNGQLPPPIRVGSAQDPRQRRRRWRYGDLNAIAKAAASANR